MPIIFSILQAPTLCQVLGWGYRLSWVNCVGLPSVLGAMDTELHLQCENCNPRAWVEEGSRFFLVREGEEGNYPTEMQKAGCSADGEVEGKA